LDIYTLEPIINVIGQVGFPAGLVLLLLIKGGKMMGKLTEAINGQTTAIAVLTERMRANENS